MLLLSIMASFGVIIGYFSFFNAIIYSALCIILIFILIYKRKGEAFIFCGALLSCVMLSTSYTLSEIERVEKFDKGEAVGYFTVMEATYIKTDKYAFIAEVKDCEPLKNGDKLLMYYDGAEIPVGQIFKGKIELEKLQGTAALSYYSSGVYGCTDLSDVRISKESNFVLSKIDLFRSFIKAEVFSGFSDSEAATMLALLTGDRSYFSDEFYNNVKSSGVAHTMVVSGMHLSIIVSFMLYVINKLFYNRYFKSFVIFATVILVTAVCGFTMSIMRASLTYLLVCLALLLNRQSKSENNLGTAVSVILIFNPLAVFNVAFQLSVLSTFGILAVALPMIEFINEKGLIKNKILNIIAAASIITLSANVLTLPVTASVFGCVSNVGLVANLLISYAVTLALVLCITGFIVYPLRKIIFAVTNLIVTYINHIINTLGDLPFATYNLPKSAVIVTVILIFVIFFILLACVRQNNVIKSKEIIDNKIKEGGKKLKWQFSSKKH